MSERHLKVYGTTPQGHILLAVPSKSRPGEWNRVLVSKDGDRVSCDCMACRFKKGARRGWFTVSRADVLAGKVERCCFHLRNAARWAPLKQEAAKRSAIS